MILCIGDLLTSQELERLCRQLAGEKFQPGVQTAGWAAREVKNNLQLQPGAGARAALQQLVKTALTRNEVFSLAASPKTVGPILFSRYETGMSYGAHVDNAVMEGEARFRSDLSFTLFLSDPESYDGGELIIDDVQGEQAFKLAAGTLVLYPSTSLHRVETVTRGTRSVAVGWVQSLVRDPGQRQILFDLETLRRRMFAKEGKTAEFDLLSKSTSNLWRLWVDL